MQKFERFIAFRYLASPRRQGFVSVIAGLSLAGICLGVATLIVVMAVMNGFRQELLDRILGINAHITLSDYMRPIDDFDAIKKTILQTPNIIEASPMIEGQVMVSANDVATGALVRAIRKEDLKLRRLISENITQGSLAEFEGIDTAIIGERLAQRLGLNVGDSIRLISPKVKAAFFGAIPSMKDYRIVGLFNVGMFEYDSGFVFIPLEAGQRFFQLPDAVNRFEIMLDAPDKTQEITLQLNNLFAQRFNIIDWKQANAQFFGSLQTERNVMFLILTLIIIVAAFNIISSMIMLVNDKAKAIAILRTIGASRSSILRIFMFTGSLIGVLGTLAGTALGLSFAICIKEIQFFLESLLDVKLFPPEVYFLLSVPAIVDPVEVVSVVLMALGLSFIATIYPSLRAANMKPADGVRHE